MGAIYKKELMGYLRSMTGYIFIGFLLAVFGIYSTAYHLRGLNPNFAYTLSAMSFVFLFSVPVLTMRSLAEERRWKTDQLLLTAPVSIPEIVAGKYLALTTIFAIPVLIMGFLPFILSCFGEVSLSESFLALAGFFLMGCAFLSIGLWASSLTENQAIAAVICFLILFGCYVEQGIASFFPETAYVSFLCIVAIIAAAAFLLALWSAKPFPCLAAGAVLESAAALIHMFFPASYEGRIKDILGIFDLSGYFSGFADGILDLRAAAYYITVILVFLLLTAASVRRLSQGTPSDRENRKALVTAAAVLAAALSVNLLLRFMPSGLTQLDLSSQQLSVLTPQTKAVLEELKKDTTLYYIVQDQNKDNNVARLLARYDDASDKVQVIQKDPVLYPEFTSAYSQDDVEENSVILDCEGKSIIISYSDMYKTDYDYITYSTAVTGFDAEGQITSALSSFERGAAAKVYALNGHEELEITDKLTGLLEKENIEVTPLGLMTQEAIPEDTDAVLLNSPAKDLTEAEADMLLAYLKKGGHAVLILDYVGERLENLETVLHYYAVKTEKGIVMETDSSRYIQLPYYILPQVHYTALSEDIAQNGSYILLSAAQGLQIDSETEREYLDAEGILSSSDNSFLKTNLDHMSVFAKEKEDSDGPFYLGICVSEAVLETDQETDQETAHETSQQTDQEAVHETSRKITQENVPETGPNPAGGETRLAVYGSSSLLDDSTDRMVAGGNSELFLDTVCWACGSGKPAGVPVKSMQVSYLTIPAASSNILSITLIIVIPCLFLAAGFIIWIRRRRR